MASLLFCVCVARIGIEAKVKVEGKKGRKKKAKVKVEGKKGRKKKIPKQFIKAQEQMGRKGSREGAKYSSGKSQLKSSKKSSVIWFHHHSLHS